MTRTRSQLKDDLSECWDEFCPDERRDLYRSMKRIRVYEEKLVSLVEEGIIRGPIHLYTGQEAIAAGVCRALGREDLLGSHHRGHAHLLAKGVPVEELSAELFGFTDGLNRGRAGAMHLMAPEWGVVGCNGIVGAGVPHVAGGLLASRMDGEDRVGVSFLGDGAVNQGVFLETLNLSKILNLPLLYVCENNQYAVSTVASEVTAGESIAGRAGSFGIDHRRIDGQNVLETYAAAKEWVEEQREEPDPKFIECVTYRFEGHFTGEEAMMGERAAYRPETEERAWRQLDPLTPFRELLEESDDPATPDVDAMDREIREEIDEAIERARRGKHPDASDAYDDFYARGDYDSLPVGKIR